MTPHSAPPHSFPTNNQFRPPYGSYNDLVLQVAAERGYKKLFLWSDDTQDASGASVGAQQGVLDGVIGSYPQPHMVLQHSVLDTSESLLALLLLEKRKGHSYRNDANKQPPES